MHFYWSLTPYTSKSCVAAGTRIKNYYIIGDVSNITNKKAQRGYSNAYGSSKLNEIQSSHDYKNLSE